MRRSLTACFAALLGALAAASAVAYAEPPKLATTGVAEPEERYYGLTIARIAIIAAPAENTVQLLGLTGLSEGRPYVQSEIRRAVKVLYQLDRFENVYVSAARIGNAVSLELVLDPRRRVREIEVIGNDALARADVEDALGLHIGSEIDVRTFGARRERLEAAYRRIGYRSAAVGIAATRVDANGNHDVTVRIDEGPRTHLGRVLIEGDPRRPPWILRNSMGVKEGEVLDLGRVERALHELAADYRRRGFLEVKIGDPLVKETGALADGEPVADLALHLEAGPLITVRFSGHHVVSLRELDDAASVMHTTEIGAGPAALAEVVERILTRYERRGYWQAEVKPLVRASRDLARKEILFLIHEGKGSYVARIRFVHPGAASGAASGASSNSALADDRLREKVLETVEDTLADEVGSPGADPQLVASIMGDRSLQKPRDSLQPDTSSPDPRRIYVPRAYSAAAAAVGDIYRAEGYYTAQVSQPKVSLRGDGTLVDVTFEIEEGVRWVLGAMSFSGNESIGSDKLLELAKIDPGKQGGEALSFFNVEEARRAMLEHYQNEGYLYARIEESLREVPERGSLSASEFVTTSSTAPLRLQQICKRAGESGRSSCDVELVFRVVEGPQVRTKTVVVRGVESTSTNLVMSEISVKQGEVLRESDMLNTKANLLRIGVFDRVSVRPLDEKNEAPEKDVVCEVRERKHSSFEIGAGASSAEGVRAFASYAHGNLFGTALRLQANAKVNVQPFLFLYDSAQRPAIEGFYDRFTVLERIDRELAVGLSYPRIFGLPEGFGAGLDLGLSHDLSPRFAQNTYTASARLDYKGLRPVLQEKPRPLAFQLKTGFEFSDLKCNTVHIVTTSTAPIDLPCTGSALSAQEGTTIYATLGPRVSFDLRDDPLNPTAGAYIELATDFAKGLTAGSTDFARPEGTANLYLPLSHGVGLAFSLFAGLIVRLEDAEIPINRRYFAGGIKTVRGYAEQSLFPQDKLPEEGQTLSSGGLLVFALKNELRFPISGALGGAIFYDIGDLFEDPAQFTINSKTRQGVGAGLRYATPVGPLSLDVGVPLVTRDQTEIGPQLHFSVRSF